MQDRFNKVIEIEIKLEDWTKFSNYIAKEKTKESAKSPSHIKAFITLIFLIALSVYIFRSLNLTIDKPTAILFINIFLIYFFYFFYFSWNQKKFIKTYNPLANGVILRKSYYIFDENGIDIQSDGIKTFYKWKIIEKIEFTDDIVMIYIDTAIALLFPCNQLDDVEKFINMINQYNNKLNK